MDRTRCGFRPKYPTPRPPEWYIYVHIWFYYTKDGKRTIFTAIAKINLLNLLYRSFLTIADQPTFLAIFGPMSTWKKQIWAFRSFCSPPNLACSLSVMFYMFVNLGSVPFLVRVCGFAFHFCVFTTSHGQCIYHESRENSGTRDHESRVPATCWQKRDSKEITKADAAPE